MDKSTFSQLFLGHFGQIPTEDQKFLLEELTEFVYKTDRFPVFLLKGYAGTGKTTVLGAFVKTMKDANAKVKLMAPTGRAAKVLALKSHQIALTIHKSIYRRVASEDGFRVSLMPNLHKNTVFIVDEASMISSASTSLLTSSSKLTTERDILEDLFEYVFSGEGCKLVFLGDEGQLPPVGSDFSPALSIDFLRQYFPKCSFTEVSLRQVVRQSEGSSILENATSLRSAEEFAFPKFHLKENSDLVKLPGEDAKEILEQAISKNGVEDTIIITRSNKRANAYNQHVRATILDFDEDLNSGDLLMAVKNNYFWLADDSSLGFIANGELLQVKKVRKRIEMYGFHFAEVTVRFIDYDNDVERDILVLLETLTVEGPNLPREEMKKLYFAIEEDYSDERNKRKRMEKIMKDPYFNALQVKFAYAVTCHKSQGGQWENVFLDQGYLTEEMLDKSYFRWLYTALTRATEKVYLMGFSDDFFV